MAKTQKKVTHQISIPGLDKEYCLSCKKWIVTQSFIDQLEDEVARRTVNSQATKTYRDKTLEMLRDLKQEKKARSQCDARL